jgi:spore coat protein H
MGTSRVAFMVAVVLVGKVFGCAKTEPDAGPEDESDRVFDTAVLHEIRIEVAPEHLAALEHDREQRVPCTFIFDGKRLENVAIRQKGGGSQSGSLYGKPSLSVRFDEIVAGQTLHGLDKLILNNADMDPTLLHEHLGFDLYRRAGIPSRRSAHAVVTLAGLRSGEQTYGVYVVVEAVNETLLARHFGPQHANGNLFEDADTGDFAANPHGLDLKDEGQSGHSRERLVAFAEFLRTATDDELLEHLDDFIDVDRYLDSFALDLLAEHVDGFWLTPRNYYLYEHPADHRFVLIPHGMDLLFEPSGDVCGVLPEPMSLPTELGRRIAGHPDLRARLEQSMDRMLDEVWDVELMLERIDTLTRLLERSKHDEPAFVDQRDDHLEARDTIDRLVRSAEQIWRNGASTCGDGVRSGNELCANMCDDGNGVDGDGCSSQCTLEFCRDGILQPGLGEVCEGHQPACTWDCTHLVVCGDGIVEDAVEHAERCDDGNTLDDDGCTNDCTPGCSFDTFAGARYAFCLAREPQTLAAGMCGYVHAAPAVPRSAEEQAWIAERTRELATGPWWIGLDSYAGQWWAGEAPATWLGWAQGEPDEPGEHACAVLDPEQDGSWDDRPCDEKHPVVCRLF